MRGSVTDTTDFQTALETKVKEQLGAQRVGYLLGAGSSYINGEGYPLTLELWDLIKDRISDARRRHDIQEMLNDGAAGIEEALDRLDDGGAMDTPYRYMVTNAIAELFQSSQPNLELHVGFVRRLSLRSGPNVKVFSLNYDPLMERASEVARVRMSDGFVGAEHAYFEPAVFDERIGRIRGTHRGRQFDETVKPIHLFKLHGSLGWYECTTNGVRRCAFGVTPPTQARRLMVPPQRRKVDDTMQPPYSALWSAFRGCLGHDPNPINGLCV